MSLLDKGQIVETLLEDEMRNSYLDYSMSVIVSRALPDVRDGLKPVHRRILFAMQELGLAPNRPYKKSARLVGEVLGKYHPHGDSSVYEACLTCSGLGMRYPLVDVRKLRFGGLRSAGSNAITDSRLSHIATLTLRA